MSGMEVVTREASVEVVTTGVEVADTVEVDVEIVDAFVVLDEEVRLTVVVELLAWSYCDVRDSMDGESLMDILDKLSPSLLPRGEVCMFCCGVCWAEKVWVL